MVAYRSKEQVRQLLACLDPRQPVVVVDNSGDVDGVSELLSRPGARYVAGEGKGFARAANLGARTSSYEYVVFCNPDTEPTTAILAELVATLEADPTCVSCSALPVDEEGKGQLGAAGWEPTPRRAIVQALGLHRFWRTGGIAARPVAGQPIDPDWMTGACLAVRRSTFLELGGFDENYFVYSEDVALGRAIKRRGLRQVMRTDLLVAHARGGSGAPALEMNRLKGASMSAYLAQHNDCRRARIMHVALVIGYALRVVERLLHGDVRTAREHGRYIAGLSSGRATVAGVEVTRR